MIRVSNKGVFMSQGLRVKKDTLIFLFIIIFPFNFVFLLFPESLDEWILTIPAFVQGAFIIATLTILLLLAIRYSKDKSVDGHQGRSDYS